MPSSYHMVVVNIIASAILGIGVLFYNFVYPKKKINLFVLLLLISILPIISIFRPGVYESGDFNLHIYRSMSFYDSLKEGNIFPSWAGELNASYGYPLFIFNYSLPYYVISFFHYLGISYVLSMKIFLSVNFLLSGIFMYLLGKTLFKKKLAAFTSAVFYLFTPYHLIDLHFKISLGEILAITILPLSFYFIYKFYNKKSYLYFLLSCLFFSFLMLSHIVVSFFTGLILLIFISLKYRKDIFKNFLSLELIFFISCAITFYNWIPLFIYKPYLLTSITGLNTAYFPTITDLLYSPWRYGFLFQGPRGEISSLIGYTQLIVIVISCIFLFFKKIPLRLIFDFKFWLIVLLILIYLISPYSKFLWESISFLKPVGSHRLLILTMFSVSILSGLLALTIKNQKWIFLLLVITILTTILNWGNRRMITDINDDYLKENLSKSTYQGEGHFYANTKWVNPKKPWFQKVPKNKLEIINGKSIIKTVKTTSTSHLYKINVIEPTLFKENTIYFPGWTASLNKKQTSVLIDKSGIINLKVNPGIYTLRISYEDLLIYRIFKLISLSLFILTITGILYLTIKSNIRTT